MELSPDEKKRVAYIEQRLTSLKIQLGKLEQYLEGLSPDPANAKMRLDSLSSFYEACLKYNEELISLQPGNPQVNIFLEVESRYFEAAGSVTKLQRVEHFLSSTLNSSNITITERQELPKLPKIKIPTFDDVSDAVKCSQLFDSLTDSALKKVSQCDPSDKDYPKAWKTLLEFYDHKRIVAVEHLNALLDLPRCTKASADELSSLLDEARQHLHILEGLDAPPGENLLVRIIERCLSPTTRSKWQDKLNMDELPKLDDLCGFIQTTIFKLQALDTSVTPNHVNNPKKRPGETPTQSSNKFAKKASHAFVTSSKSEAISSQSTYLTCPECNKAHQLFKCPAFSELGVHDR
ncbi:uncharacterized protein LOC107045667 [Diachasma alloeum]|uniref:uncharacterized protein LOC107045667 n=1 Tax=Diachasma alloeum TaxID=454923 RepID=UPI0007384B75|nr:uncharacterized protein LOC107045667 [Diachasma alloeum]